MKNKNLESLREVIDTIDDQIVVLLRKRWEVVTDIGQLKKTQRLPVYDEKREEDVIARLKQRVPMILWSALEEVYRAIFRASRQLE